MSPYLNQPTQQWQSITDNLIASHPLTLQNIHDAVFKAWSDVWTTVIGGQSGYRLIDASPLPPAQVIGYLLEMLVAKEINLINNNFIWGQGSQKDIHCISNDNFSIEMKTSGQLGYKVFGNRSYGQTGTTGKKDKSGFYITVNYYDTTITLIRFGWIDSWDWTSQTASTGQAATLSNDAYAHKLKIIHGPYRLKAPVQIVTGIGPSVIPELHALGIITIEDLFYKHNLLTTKKLTNAYNRAYELYGYLLQP
ncbi:ScaI family restriction endonuclease [Acinetobacter baumannii]|uniref:ScaI family restriction endonuclease n=1 Tax=Acinetobacter baumannii TaxID=470 RepID=UPI000F672931|nr:ScaI family restriction endonuclease [Acinetobacter baumannii]MBU3095744.1 ScaI family restriction endonuclease [Acinetobacter baumannii]MDC5165942.1 ScaI family restriction endonuclease [Acinetobacter baumannii]RSF40776.1 ScaI family restriction endonuclease [Acinetobacter baumannii]HAV5945239.1 ScaI family restriction endonuclease [Acinetobacter baumannii]